MDSLSGIYMIVNKINGHAYIGQSNNISRRWMEHKCPGERRRGTVLNRAFKKYGIENFDLIVLEYCPIEELDEKERCYIAKYNPIYNMNEGGRGNVGHIVSNEVRKLIADKSRLQWQCASEEEKRRRITHNLKGPPKGHPVLPETREKLRRATTEHLRKYGPSENQRRASSRRVIKINATTNDPLEVFDNMLLAGASIGVSSSAICYACKDPNRTSSGYKWKYLD